MSDALTNEDGFAQFLKQAGEEAEKYETCMSLYVNNDGNSVELVLDTSVPTYGDWIKGEGGDISLIRSRETGKVMGCRLPLYNKKLCIYHDGPIRINAGFRKEEDE